VFILNDPYNGGITHLNDHLLLVPVFNKNELMAWVCNIAHWGDVGGHVPGSQYPDATEIF
jgi:N-methylhydantoinase B